MTYKRFLTSTLQALVMSLILWDTSHATSPFEVEFERFLVQGKFTASNTSTPLLASNTPEETKRQNILKGAKDLNQRWTLSNAISFMNLCHAYLIENTTNPLTERACLAYRALSALRANFTEDAIDIEKRTHAGPNLTGVLEILKTSIQNCPTKEDLPFFDTPVSYFNQEDIPQGRVCCLLGVAYRQYTPSLAAGANDPLLCSTLSNGIFIYLGALRGTTTPSQRIHYHEMILSLGRPLVQNSHFMGNEGAFQLANIQGLLHNSEEIVRSEKNFFSTTCNLPIAF